MKITNYLFCILLSIPILSFAPVEKKVNHKQKQLEKKVLAHYQHDSNPLKLQAARFLLTNIKDKFSIEGERTKMYADTVKKYYRDGNILHKKLFPLRYMNANEVEVDDVESLTPEYLIENIDRAFATWQSCSWKKDISFSDFCEYILPYRIGYEPLESWRKEILQDSIFQIVGDSLHTFSDEKAALVWFTKKCARYKKSFLIKWGTNAADIPDLPYSTLRLLSTGTCANLNSVTMFLYRAAGFPITSDFTPHWANKSCGHDWAAVTTPEGFSPFHISGNEILGYYKGSDDILSKIYRKTFSENAQSHAKLRGSCDFLPYLFNSSRLLDVTDLYIPTSTIKIAIPTTKNPNNEKFAYLAVSEHYDWEPVAWGTIANGVASFSKIGKNCVYMPMLISANGSKFANYPFVVTDSGMIRYFKPDLKNIQNVSLNRKYPIGPYIKMYINRMRRAKFQASNNADFKDAVTLYTITDDPGLYRNEKPINSTENYRYVRYLSSNPQCCVAELEFFETADGKPLKGNVIGTKGYQPLENAFDGNLLTYTESETTKQPQWVGLDLGRPTQISKIAYVTRNDQNHITVGDEYELFYCDGDWKPLGKQTATGKTLEYKNVPANSLLLLRNYTRGREERMFTYENGEQVWR